MVCLMILWFFFCFFRHNRSCDSYLMILSYHNQISMGHFLFQHHFPLLLKKCLPKTPSLILLTFKPLFFGSPVAVFWSTMSVSIFQFRTGLYLSEGDFVCSSAPGLLAPSLLFCTLSTWLSDPKWALELVLLDWGVYVSTYIYLFKFIVFSFS